MTLTKLKTTLSQAEKKWAQETYRHHTNSITPKQEKECPPQATPAAPKPWQARVVHTALTLQKSHNQFPVGACKKRPPGASQRACRRDISQGTAVPHDGPAEVPVGLDAGRHQGVTGVQMAGMRSVLAPVTQCGSGAFRLGGGDNVGRAARMNHGDIQQGGTMRAGERSPQYRHARPDG
jgi:hypothetical protein